MDPEPVPILFMTNSEYGQANVVLAVAQELAFNPAYEVHIASFADLKLRVFDMNADARIARPIRFHSVPVNIPAMSELIRRYHVTMLHKPGMFRAIISFIQLYRSMFGWDADEYMTVYSSFLTIIQDVGPAALIIDPILWMAHDAARTLDLNYIILTPSSAKELGAIAMPFRSGFWRYPLTGMGYSYPLSIFASAKCIFLAICAIVAILLTGHVSRFRRARKQANIKHKFPLLDMVRKDDLILTPHLPEIDYPNSSFPINVLSCGPIILPVASLDQVEPDINMWLEQNPTVLINIGTHFTSNVHHALEQAKGIRKFLDARADVQVLWKLNYQWSDSPEIIALVDALVIAGRLRITAWLQYEPSAILATDRIICSVHHGGANSFYEACRAGVPQVILPVWWDTYEYAARAEWLGIGLVGNRGVAPSVEGEQFGEALTRAMQDGKMRGKARELGEACRRREGRIVAADLVARWAAEKAGS